MFYGCGELQDLDLGRWNTSNLTNIWRMFYDCRELTSLDISGWNTANVGADIAEWNEQVFGGCASLNTIKLGINSLNTNIFAGYGFENYDKNWYYMAAGMDASDPLPLMTVKTNASLFTSYDYETMAGTWTSKPPAVSVTIMDSDENDITGKTVTVETVSYQLMAFSEPSDAEQSVTWKSSDTSIATVSTAGKVTFKKAGTVTITATSTDRAKASATVKLKLLPEATAIVIKNSAGTAITGKTVTSKTVNFQLKASAAPAAALQTVTWKSSNTNIATVTAAGKVTFKKAGTVTITATSKDRGKVTATVKLTLLPKATKIIISRSLTRSAMAVSSLQSPTL